MAAFQSTSGIVTKVTNFVGPRLAGNVALCILISPKILHEGWLRAILVTEPLKSLCVHLRSVALKYKVEAHTDFITKFLLLRLLLLLLRYLLMDPPQLVDLSLDVLLNMPSTYELWYVR